MKKIISILTLAVSAAMAMTACNDVGTTSDISDGSSSETEAAVTTLNLEEIASEAGLDEVPTDRVPEIVSSESFDYDVVGGEAVITAYTGKDRVVEVPEEIDGKKVTKIGPHSFEANYQITSVTLPDTVTIIGESAFMDCGDLKTITLPSNLEEIQRAAFSACTSPKEITVPASVTLIYEEAFVACESLRALTLENPDLTYNSWGLEELPKLKVYAPDDSNTAAWVEAMGLAPSEDDSDDDYDDGDDYDDDTDDYDDDYDDYYEEY